MTTALARAGEADALAAADADIIVSTLDEVDLPALSQGCVARKKEPPDSFSSTTGRRAQFTRKTSTAERTGGVGGTAMIADSQDAGAFTAYPDALRFIVAIRRRRDPCRRGLLLPTMRASSCARSAWYCRGRERVGVRPGEAGAHPPGVFDTDISGRDFAQGSRILKMFLTRGAKS